MIPTKTLNEYGKIQLLSSGGITIRVLSQQMNSETTLKKLSNMIILKHIHIYTHVHIYI